MRAAFLAGAAEARSWPRAGAEAMELLADHYCRAVRARGVEEEARPLAPGRREVKPPSFAARWLDRALELASEERLRRRAGPPQRAAVEAFDALERGLRDLRRRALRGEMPS